jgi:hypothetical protein
MGWVLLLYIIHHILYLLLGYNKGKNNPFYNKKHKLENIKIFRENKIGDKNPSWKGDNVGYFGLHKWVKKHLPKPIFCENCNIKIAMDLANITGVYNREFINWKYLCRSCHARIDRKILNLKHQKRIVV